MENLLHVKRPLHVRAAIKALWLSGLPAEAGRLAAVDNPYDFLNVAQDIIVNARWLHYGTLMDIVVAMVKVREQIDAHEGVVNVAINDNGMFRILP